MSAGMFLVHIRGYCFYAHEEKGVALCCESSGGFYPNDATNRWKGVSRSQTRLGPECVGQNALEVSALPGHDQFLP